jgi:thioredoxin-related protein
MKRLGSLVVISLLLIVGTLAGRAFAEVSWMSLKDGAAKARMEKKPMLVDFFFGKGCPRCEAMQKLVYDDPAISRKIMADFIPIKIDLTKPLTDEEEKLGEKYEFKHDCLLLFLDDQGEIIKDTMGKRLCFIDKIDPEWFVSYLDMVKSKFK